MRTTGCSSGCRRYVSAPAHAHRGTFCFHKQRKNVGLNLARIRGQSAVQCLRYRKGGDIDGYSRFDASGARDSQKDIFIVSGFDAELVQQSVQIVARFARTI